MLEEGLVINCNILSGRCFTVFVIGLDLLHET